MGVALRGLDQGMTEQLGYGHHLHAVHGGDRSPVVTEVMKPQPGQTRLVADAVPLVLEIVDVPRRGTRRKQERAIVTVARDGVDDRAGGARQPDRARPGLRIGKVDALARDPVPFERDDFSSAASGEHQQADDGDGLRAIEHSSRVSTALSRAISSVVRNRSLGSIWYRLAFLQGLELCGR